MIKNIIKDTLERERERERERDCGGVDNFNFIKFSFKGTFPPLPLIYFVITFCVLSDSRFYHEHFSRPFC